MKNKESIGGENIEFFRGNLIFASSRGPMATSEELASFFSIFNIRIQTKVGLPSLPDMIFPKNKITIIDPTTNCKIAFDAIEALKEVSMELPDFQVSASTEWKNHRLFWN